MQNGDLDLLTLLFSVNVTPTQISHIMEELRGLDGGKFTTKRIYDMNQKMEDLHDYVTGLLPESNDAEKTISKLERSSISHF